MPHLYSASAGVKIVNGKEGFLVDGCCCCVEASVDFLPRKEELPDFCSRGFLEGTSEDCCLPVKADREEALLVRSFRASLEVVRSSLLPGRVVSRREGFLFSRKESALESTYCHFGDFRWFVPGC